MKNTFILFLVFLFVVFQAVGQENRLYTEVQQAKQMILTK